MIFLCKGYSVTKYAHWGNILSNILTGKKEIGILKIPTTLKTKSLPCYCKNIMNRIHEWDYSGVVPRRHPQGQESVLTIGFLTAVYEGFFLLFQFLYMLFLFSCLTPLFRVNGSCERVAIFVNFLILRGECL